MANANFEWCFEIGQKVGAIMDSEKAKDDDVFEVIRREVDEDNEQWFDIRRISDGEVWENVSPSSMFEVK